MKATVNRDLIKISDWSQVNWVSFNAVKKRSCPLTHTKSDEQPFYFGGVNVAESVTVDVVSMRIKNDVCWIKHGFDVLKDAVNDRSFLSGAKNTSL